MKRREKTVRFQKILVPGCSMLAESHPGAAEGGIIILGVGDQLSILLAGVPGSVNGAR